MDTHVSETPKASAVQTSRFSVCDMLHAINVWRSKRPLVGSIILALGGWFVMKPMVGASFQMVVHMGMRGASPYLLGGGMMVAALMGVVAPSQRHFPAIMAMACSVLSLPFANLGGWLIGMVLGIIGSGMVFAWAPYTDKQLARFAAKEKRRQERKALKRASKSQPVAG